MGRPGGTATLLIDLSFLPHSQLVQVEGSAPVVLQDQFVHAGQSAEEDLGQIHDVILVKIRMLQLGQVVEGVVRQRGEVVVGQAQMPEDGRTRLHSRQAVPLAQRPPVRFD